MAKEEARGLRNEVVLILLHEIESRQLSSKLKDYVFASRRILSKLEKETLRRKVKESRCSLCRENRELAGYRVVSITGILIETISIEQDLILCESCGLERYRKASRQTMMFGWWSILGIIQTSGEVIHKTRRLLTGEELEREDIIDNFLNEYLVPITLGNDDAQIIENLLEKYNQRELSK